MKHDYRDYEAKAAQRWQGDRVRQSNERWSSYDEEKRQKIIDELYAIFKKLSDHMQLGTEHEAVREILVEWHEYFGYFYEPSLEVLRGLGDVYKYDPEFRVYFDAIDPDMADFAHEAINQYVDSLEMKWLESQYEVLVE